MTFSGFLKGIAHMCTFGYAFRTPPQKPTVRQIVSNDLYATELELLQHQELLEYYVAMVATLQSRKLRLAAVLNSIPEGTP